MLESGLGTAIRKSGFTLKYFILKGQLLLPVLTGLCPKNGIWVNSFSPFLHPNNCDISPTRKMFPGIVAQIGADRDFLQKRAQAMDE